MKPGLPISRGIKVLLVVGTLALTAVSSGQDWANWLGSWRETGASLETSTRLTYPLVGAISAWVSTRPRRLRFEGWVFTGARTRLRILAGTAVALGIWASAGFLLVAAVLSSLTAVQANLNSPPWLSIVSAVAGFFASASVGVALGQFMPPQIAPVTAVAVVFGWAYLCSGLTVSLEPFEGFAVASDRSRTLFEFAPWTYAMRSIFMVAVALASLSVAARHRSSWFIWLTVTCLTATPLILTGPAALQYDPESSREVCSQRGDIRICLTAARSHEMEDVFEAATPLLAELRGLSPGAFELRDESLNDTPAVQLGAKRLTVPVGVVNGFNGNAHQIDATEFRIVLASRILRSMCQPQTEARGNLNPEATVTDVIEASALKAVGVPIDGSAGFNGPILTSASLDFTRVKRFQTDWNASDDQTRRRWLDKNRQEVLNCQFSKDALTL